MSFNFLHRTRAGRRQFPASVIDRGHIRIHLRIHVRVGRETERLVSRFPGLMDRQVNKRIANSPQRNYRRIRRPRWPTVSAKTIDKRAHLPFMKRSREETSRPSRIATISSSFSSSPLSLSFSSLHTCLPICPFDLFSSSLPPSLSLSPWRVRGALINDDNARVKRYSRRDYFFIFIE